MNRLFVTLALALPLLTNACSSSDGSPSDDAAANDANVAAASSTCTHDAYAAGLASYKKAVASAGSRLSKGVCESDDGYLADIVASASASVASCSAFHGVIATSPWARPLRDALAGNLALPELTGKLTTSSWAGLDDALVGVTLFGPAPGVYGNMSKLELHAGGEVVVSKLVVDDAGKASWTSSKATWKVGARAVGGAIAIDVAGASYLLSEDPRSPGIFTLQPTAGGDAFSSIPSECEV